VSDVSEEDRREDGARVGRDGENVTKMLRANCSHGIPA